MNVRASEALWLAVAIVVVVALTLARPEERATPSTYSSYDTGPNGYRALYEVMRKEGVPTSRLERELGTLREFHGTLVVSQGTFLDALGSVDVQRLAALVRAGARLVVLGNVVDASGAQTLHVPGAVTIAQTMVATRVARDSDTDGVTEVTATMTSAFSLRKEPRIRTLLAAGGKSVAVALSLGKGSIVAITAPGIFSNAVLARDQNARFAYDVLSSNGALLFDERVHGYAVGASMWDVLPQSVRGAVWLAVAMLALAIIGSLFRSAPPIALAPPRLRDSSAYVASMAALLRRAHAGAAAIERFAEDAARLARNRPGGGKRPDIVAQLALLETLRASTHPDDSALLVAARADAYVRKELA